MTLQHFLRYLVKRSRYNIRFGQEWNNNPANDPVDVGTHVCVLALAQRMQGLLEIGDIEGSRVIGKRLKKQITCIDEIDS